MTAREARRRALKRQIARLDGRLAALRRTSDRYGRWRLGSFLAALVLSAGSLLTWGIWAWVGVTAVAILPFVFLVRANRLVDEAIARHAIWRQLKQTHAARMDLDWAQIPAAPPAPPRLDHPFALDLDLLGDHSLLQLLDTADGHVVWTRTVDQLPQITRRGTYLAADAMSTGFYISSDSSTPSLLIDNEGNIVHDFSPRKK